MFFRSPAPGGVSPLALTLFTANVTATPVSGYGQTNLVSDIPGRAAHTDANLMRTRGVSPRPAAVRFWVSGYWNRCHQSLRRFRHSRSLVVTIPVARRRNVRANRTGLQQQQRIQETSSSSQPKDGTIAGWRGSLGTTAETLFDDSAAGAVYKGLAIAAVGSDHYLYAADFHNNRVNVLPSAGAPALTGSFTDPTLPAGYAPFNVQSIDGQLS